MRLATISTAAGLFLVALAGVAGANETHTNHPDSTQSASSVALEPVTIVAEGLIRTK